MPRAFLITRRRYDGTGEFEETGRESYSPERGVRLADYGGGQQPTSDGASECGSCEDSSSECPEELYNLTKLAEVSLAAAAGTLVVHPTRASLYQRPLQPLRHQDLEERSRMFFERIEAERESLVELKARRLDEENRGYEEYKSENTILTDKSGASSTATSIAISDKGSSVSFQNQSEAQHPQQENGCTEEHECPDCGKKYSTSSNLARHRQTHRSLGDKKARRCPHCDKVYVSIPAFSMHVRTHNQGCKCHYCGKCFSRPWLLQGHIRTHTGEKPFKCTICNKAFADKSNLRAHIQTHSNTKPHVCSRCGKAFALKSYLYKHEESSCMRSHHKRESSNSPVASAQSPPTASPTSVIVPPRNLQQRPNSAFSAIVRPDDQGQKDLLSRIVIRTSVISPNPEHLRFGEKKLQQQQQQQQQQAQQQAIDLNDPTRLSAFSRPQPMTLNLAIA